MSSSLHTRRRFLQLASAAPAALFSARAAEAAKKIPIGIELYGVRGELGKDLPNTLRTVAKIGYEVVEFYAPYFGWTLDYAKGVRAQLDELGLRCLSTHNGFDSLTAGATMDKAIELNRILGAHQIILSSAPRTKTADDWKRLCERLTAAVQELKPHGMTTGFHNHHSEWLPLDGGPRPMDIVAANTTKEFVLQFDVGTAVEAGVDTVAWIKANPGRIRSIHLKDWAPGDKAAEKGYRVLFGEGVTPWKELVAAAESVGGVEHYLMEQEGSRFSEFETAEKCLAAWKKLRAG